MENFGKRLKEERERLGLSQANFAELCGVGRTAQFNYERGERHPASLYLDAAEKLGVDTHYVFTGTRKGKDWAFARAYSRMLYTFEMLLGLEENRLAALAQELVTLDGQLESEDGQRPAIVDFGPWTDGFLNWIGTATNVERCVDVELLAKLVDAVTQEAEKAGVALATEKRLRAALMLYREAKESGEIQRARVVDSVRLAA